MIRYLSFLVGNCNRFVPPSLKASLKIWRYFVLLSISKGVDCYGVHKDLQEYSQANATYPDSLRPTC